MGDFPKFSHKYAPPVASILFNNTEIPFNILILYECFITVHMTALLEYNDLMLPLQMLP